jgi:hypothetical protein
MSQPAMRPPGPRLVTGDDVAQLPPLDLNRLTEVWDAAIGKMRESAGSLLVTALQHATPQAVTAGGVVTLALEEPNEFYARAIERAGSDVVTILREWFHPVQRVVVRESETAAPARRMTGEMARAATLESLRRKDPVLSAAIDALDLELME